MKFPNKNHIGILGHYFLNQSIDNDDDAETRSVYAKEQILATQCYLHLFSAVDNPAANWNLIFRAAFFRKIFKNLESISWDAKPLAQWLSRFSLGSDLDSQRSAIDSLATLSPRFCALWRHAFLLPPGAIGAREAFSDGPGQRRRSHTSHTSHATHVRGGVVT